METELAHERAARQVAEQVFAGEMAVEERAAQAAGSYCKRADEILRREEWLRDCAEADLQRAEEALRHERAARLVLERLLAQEAAAAEAAEAHWRPAGSRGGRGGRGGRGRPPPPQQSTQQAQQTQPPPPPPPPPPTPQPMGPLIREGGFSPA